MAIKILIIFLSIFFLNSCSDSEPPISGRVPEISLSSHSGLKKSINYKDSKYLLLVFWATWCQPCIMEIPVLVKMKQEFGEQGLQIVSILADNPQKDVLNGIVSEFKINYEILLGDEETMKKFGNISSFPTSYVVNREGKIVEKILGMISEYELREKIISYLSK